MGEGKGGKVETCSRIMDGNRRLGRDELRRTWMDYFDGMHNGYSSDCGFGVFEVVIIWLESKLQGMKWR